MQSSLPASPSHSDISDYIWKLLRSGRVVPGYGHGVLRKPDPRFRAMTAFAADRPEVASDPVVQLMMKVSEGAPGVLTEHGKVRA